jgi:hypothetical protein
MFTTDSVQVIVVFGTTGNIYKQLGTDKISYRKTLQPDVDSLVRITLSTLQFTLSMA